MTVSRKVEPGSDKMEASIYRYILHHTWKDQLWLIVLILMSLPFVYIGLEIPKTIINEVLSGQSNRFVFFTIEFDRVEFLLLLSFAFLALIVVNGILKYVINVYRGALGERMLRRFRYTLYSRVLRFPLPHFKKVSAGELIPMITSESEPLGGFIGDSIALPAFQGGLLLTYVGFIFVQDIWLGLAAIALYPPQAYLIPKLQRKINKLSRQRVKSVRKLAYRVGETVSSAADIRANDTGYLERADISYRLGKIFKIRNEIFRRKFFIKFLNNFLGQLTPFFFFSIGGYLVLQGRLTLGALVAVLAAYKDIGPPWKELLKFYQISEDTRVKYAQIIKQFEPENIQNEELHFGVDEAGPRFYKSVSGNNVSLTAEYHHSKLEGVNFNLLVPEHTGILCAEGETGKELGLLLSGLDPPVLGDLRFDDYDVKDLPEAALGKNIGYCSPSSQLLNVSVQDNLLYGLKHRPVEGDMALELPEPELVEAKKSGNSIHNVRTSWVDFHTVGVQTQEEFEVFKDEVISAVELDQDIMGLAQRLYLKGKSDQELMKEIVAARTEVRDAIRDLDDGKLIETFERTVYSQNLTVAENLLFGTPYDTAVDLEDLTFTQDVQDILSATELNKDLINVGLEATRLMIELFENVDTDSDFFTRYSFIEASKLSQYRELIEKIDISGTQRLSGRDSKLLISVALRISPAQHRLNLITPEIQGQIIAARKLIMDKLGYDNDIIQFIDKDSYQSGMNVRANLLFGKIAHDRRHLQDRIHQRLNQVLSTLGLGKTILNRGLQFHCGEAGANLPQTFRQKLLLARALIKNPDVLIIEEPLSALNFESQKRIFTNVKKLRDGKNMIWIFSDKRFAEEFDQVLSFDNSVSVS